MYKMTEAPSLPKNGIQGMQDSRAFFKPSHKPGTYNPNVEMKSSLYMANKRMPYAPTNFIGVNTIRPDNMQPTRTFKPAGINGPYVPTVPIMTTQPVQAKFQ